MEKASDGSCLAASTDCITPANAEGEIHERDGTETFECKGDCEFDYRSCHMCEVICAKAATETLWDGTFKAGQNAVEGLLAVALELAYAPPPASIPLAIITAVYDLCAVGFEVGNALKDWHNVLHLGGRCTRIIAEHF